MEDLFNFQQRNHSMPDWREAYKILSVSGRPASRRAIDFSRAFWYRLLQDKVVWTCSTPITQAHRCRRCILLPAYDKRRSSARERQNGGAWAEGNGGGNKTERKCVKKSNIFYEILLFVIRVKQLFISYLENWNAWIDDHFSRKMIFLFNHRKIMDTLSRRNSDKLSYFSNIGNKQINSESKFWILESRIGC